MSTEKLLKYLMGYKYTEEDRLRHQKRIKMLKDAGCCTRCAVQLPDGYPYFQCKECRKKEKEKRQEYKDAGLCTACHRPLSDEDKAGGYVTCAHCRQVSKIRRRQQLKAEGKTDKFEKKIARGGDITKCTLCHGAIDEPGYLMCSRCRKTRKEYARKRSKKNKKAKSKDAKLK